MNLVTDLRQLDNPTLSRDERALIRCQAAADLIHAGQYEAAREALGELWSGLGKRPNLEGLKRPETKAEVLLQCGVLSGWIGSARNLGGAQEQAKDLISEAQRIFKSHHLPVKVAEAQYELGICYWRLGAFDEARVVISEAAEKVADKNDDLKAKILIRRSLIETWACRYHDALEVLKEAEPFFSHLNDAFKGRWHGQMGLALRRIGFAEGRSDYLDRAILEHTAAIYHYEQAGHERYCAVNLNNLAMLLYRVGRYQEAHQNLDRAIEIFSRLQDPGNLAQVNETRARLLLGERRYSEAGKVIESAVRIFEQGGEQSCLADALTIQATVLTRLGQHERSIALFRRAISVAANAGSSEKAGQAAISLIEEHGKKRLSEIELFDTYRSADELLKSSQDMEDIKRLRACARVKGRRLPGGQLSDPDFSLQKAVHAYEARFIKQALEQSQGSVTRAARLLGFPHHSSLAKLLEGRHKELLEKRTPAVPRRQSIARGKEKAARKRGSGSRAELRMKKETQPITVLHVEDNSLVAGAVRDSLKMEGWTVESFGEGNAALKTISGDTRYDVLIFDNELPDANGVELIRQTRRLPHRQQTPIIMFSASDVEGEARRAGADVFLRKPEDMHVIAETIVRLLAHKAQTLTKDTME